MLYSGRGQAKCSRERLDDAAGWFGRATVVAGTVQLSVQEGAAAEPSEPVQGDIRGAPEGVAAATKEQGPPSRSDSSTT